MAGVGDVPVLLPYQRRWLDDRSPLKVCVKSRQIGISWTAALEGVLVAGACRQAGGMNVWYMVHTEDDAKEWIEDVAWWARVLQIGFEGRRERILTADGHPISIETVRFASGYKARGMASVPYRLHGKRGYAILDEAARHEDLNGWLEATGAFTMWGGRRAIISTQAEVDNPFNRYLEGIQEGRYVASVHTITLDHALADGLYRRICLVTGRTWSEAVEREWRRRLIEEDYPDHADTQLFCIPARAGSVYLPRSVIEQCQQERPVFRLALEDDFAVQAEDARAKRIDAWLKAEILPQLVQLPRNCLHYLGQDFGRSSDLSVLAPGIGRDDMLEVPFVVELRNVPVMQQQQILFFILDRLPRLTKVAMDATGNGMAIAEFAWQKYGDDVVERVMLNDKRYAEILPRFRTRLQEAKMILPNDGDIVSDLTSFRTIDGVPKLPKQKTKQGPGQTRHGDAAIALALLHYAASGSDDLEDLAARMKWWST